MATFADLKQKVIRLLGDEVVTGPPLCGTDYTADLLKDSLHASLDAILPWCWKRATIDLAGSEDVFELPDDFYRIEAIFDNDTDAYLSPLVQMPGTMEAETGGNGWMEYPEGSISLLDDFSSDGGVLYYAASWSKPSGEKDVIEAPVYVHTALCLFAASYCLLQKATMAGNLAQYKRRIDSGDPTDNPLCDLSTYFLKRFDIEMSRIPTRMKAVQ